MDEPTAAQNVGTAGVPPPAARRGAPVPAVRLRPAARSRPRLAGPARWAGPGRLAGPARLALRLAARDLRYRPGTLALAMLALLAATTTLTLAVAVRGSAEVPWDRTFAATAGPDAVVTSYRDTPASRAELARIAAAPEVAGTAGPYPLLAMPAGALVAAGHRIDVEVVARDAAPAAVDRPYLTGGGWIRPGAVVVEQSFADALGVAPGDQLSIAGQPLRVAGVAVTTSRQPTPFSDPGLVWATRADTARLTPAAETRGLLLMLRLSDPAAAPAFAAAHTPPVDDPTVIVEDWQSTRLDALTDVLFAQFGLIVGAVSLALLAAASVAVGVAGRMAAQARRAGVLKAVGATGRFVAAVLLVEYLGLALLTGAAGLLAGALLAPWLAQPVSGVLGSAAPARPGWATAGLVLGTAGLLVGGSALLPALRRSRASTVRALAGPARAPRRSRRLIGLSARLPVPLLLGVRLAARRPARAALSAAGLSVTVAAVVVALWMQAGIDGDTTQVAAALGRHAVTYDKLRLVTYAFIGALVVLAAVNAVLVAWATALDNARTAALARALGATPGQVTLGLTLAGVLPAAGAVLVGVPAGFLVFTVAAATAGTGGGSPTPAATGLLALLPATLLLVAGLTAVPSRLAGRRPALAALRAD